MILLNHFHLITNGKYTRHTLGVGIVSVCVGVDVGLGVAVGVAVRVGVGVLVGVGLGFMYQISSNGRLLLSSPYSAAARG